MNFLTHFKLSLTTLFLLALLPLNVYAGLAGHVILTKGNVSAVSETGDSRSLKRRSKIMSGDIIKTGTGSSVQIRFIDKALMTIKANSEMNITEYQLENPKEGGKEKALMRLVKGGFRTISGQIGKGDKSAYKVDTPAASIGIRGTNYEVQQESNGDFVMAVYSGGISVENESGSIELGLGSDFNFTRVAGKGAPKGLLIAPATLSENSATDEPAEEESETVATTEGEEKSESETDNDSEESTVAESESSDESQSSDEQTAETTSNTDGATQGVTEEVADALDEKLSETLKENKEQFEEQIVTELEEQGYLADGESLADLDPTVLENLENLGSLDNLEDAANLDLNEDGVIEGPSTTDPTPIEPVDPVENEASFIQNLYADLASVNNPFPATYTQDSVNYDLITDEEYNLAASEKLGVLVMPMNFSQDADGDLSFNFGEANISSPTAIEDANYANTISYSGTDTHIEIYYELLDTTDNSVDEYRVQVPIDGTITSPSELLSAIQNGLTSGSDIYLNDVLQSPGAVDDILVSLDAVANTTTSVFNFTPTTSSTTFMTQLGLHFSGNDSDSLAEQLGGDSMADDWRNEADIELMITSGAWESSTTDDGRPILVMSESQSEFIQNDDGTSAEITIDRNEVIRANGESVIASNLLSFATCGDTGGICSIQVLKDDEKIRWGAWLTEPGKGIQIYEQKDDPNSAFSESNIHEEDKILAFWLAAERADINTLTGTAQFSNNGLDCTDYSQCIGFADDGLVQKLTGQFDVNFGTGAITNGNLNIEVSDDISFGIFGAEQGTAISTWDVNFSGQMESGKPEFATNSVNGTITDNTGSQISNQVIGNVGGIFVDPGDIFAGGYNLGTADGTDKHASGVFTLDKQP